MTRAVRIGTRTSPLARAQADHVGALLTERGMDVTFVGITTTGDVDRRALTEIGGTGVFVSAVREALRADTIDLAVHSLKDLPTAAEPDLELAAVPHREDVRDVLVGGRLNEIRSGWRIGTGAPRRAIQLHGWAADHGLDLDVVPVRGNVGTRLELVRRQTVDAVVLAAAGLRRLALLPAANPGHPSPGVAGLPAEILGTEVMLPAPGQGALALEISTRLPRSHPEAAIAIRSLDDPRSRAEALAERGFLAGLEAGCTAPVGARAIVKSVRGSTLDLTLTAVIGRTLQSNLADLGPATSPLRFLLEGSSSTPREFGLEAAAQVLAKLPMSTTRSSEDEAE